MILLEGLRQQRAHSFENRAILSLYPLGAPFQYSNSFSLGDIYCPIRVETRFSHLDCRRAIGKHLVL